MIDKYGNEIWMKKWNKTATSFVQTKDKAFLVANTFNGEFNIVKINESGVILLTKNLDSASIMSITKLEGEEFLLSGQKEHDLHVQKIDSLLNPKWVNEFGFQNANEGAVDIGIIKYDEFIIGGTRVYTTPYAEKMLIIKIDSSGNLLWANEIGDNPLRDIIVYNDSSIFCFGENRTGVNQGDIHIYKLNSSGSITGFYLFNQFISEWAWNSTIVNDTTIAIVGAAGYQYLDVLLFGFNPDAQIISGNSTQEIFTTNIYQLRQNYPNPFNPTTKIKFRIADFGFVNLKVYDILGNEIATLVNEEKQPGIYEVEFNSVGTSRDLSLPSGIYFYQLRAGQFVETKKMLLLK